jgi:2-polyprenyl-6-methoxyphenol hydroxylase-like FAD-dependent oxidoreductase
MTEQLKQAEPGRRAVVIGGSLAGLITARALANHFDRVTIVERDVLPDDLSQRVGVPQGHHLHVLLARGRVILDQLLPGFLDDLKAAGSVRLDTVADVAWLYTQGWNGTFESGLVGEGCTRPLMELCVRRRLLLDARIEIRQALDVVGLITAGGAVRGVQLRPRGEREAPVEELAADFVADASGRGSRAPQWLEQLGYGRPAETIVNAFAGYASAVFEPPASTADLPWKGIYLQAQPPQHLRAGIVLPVEGGRWIATVYGLGKDYPPTDLEGFLAFTRTLRSKLLYHTLKDARLLEPIVPYRGTENRLRHFERLPRWPERFIVVGDAVCAFNPIYGQGITTAALGAQLLDECFRNQLDRHPGDLNGLGARFQKQLAKSNQAPWMLATTEDARVPGAEGTSLGLSTRLMHRFLDHVVRRASRDAVVNQTLSEVFHMMKTPAAFFTPRVLPRLIWKIGAEQPHHPVPAEEDLQDELTGMLVTSGAV